MNSRCPILETYLAIACHSITGNFEDYSLNSPRDDIVEIRALLLVHACVAVFLPERFPKIPVYDSQALSRRERVELFFGKFADEDLAGTIYERSAFRCTLSAVESLIRRGNYLGYPQIDQIAVAGSTLARMCIRKSRMKVLNQLLEAKL